MNAAISVAGIAQHAQRRGLESAEARRKRCGFQPFERQRVREGQCDEQSDNGHLDVRISGFSVTGTQTVYWAVHKL